MSVARLCLGTAKIGLPWYGLGSVSRPGPDEIVAILQRAQRLGIAWFDTGAAYGDAEDWLSVAGAPCVVTKLAPGLVREGAFYTRAGADFIEGVMLHNPSVADLQDDTLIGMLDDKNSCLEFVGASVYTPEEARAAIAANLGAIQVPYCLLDRRHEGTMCEATAAGLKVFARQPFLQGLLTNRLPPDLFEKTGPTLAAHVLLFRDRLDTLCAAHGVSRVQACLWFALDSPADYVVFGVGSVAHLEEVVGAAEAYRRGADRWLELGQALLEIASAIPPIEFGSLWKQEAAT